MTPIALAFLAGVGALLACNHGMASPSPALRSGVAAASRMEGEKGMVAGVITGPSTVPIPGAKVTLEAADGSRQTVVADQKGRYSFPSVEPANYTISVEAAGYQPLARADVRVAGGGSTTVNLILTATGPPRPDLESPFAKQPGFYDDAALKASGVKTTIDAAGYSSQAQTPRRLLTEGPSLSANPPPPRKAGMSEATEAEHKLLEALRADPNDFDINHKLGEYYLSEGYPNDGIPYLEKARELKPGDSSNGYDLARAYLDAKNPAKARPLLQGLIRREDAAQFHNLLGEADEALHDPFSAVKEFQLAVQMDPSEKNVFDFGNELLLAAHTNHAAIEEFRRGIALYPNSVRMYIGLAIALYARNSYDEAIEALCHASDLDPSDSRPYEFLGKIYNVSKGRAGEVRKRMERFMETNPQNPLAYYYGALCLWKGSPGGGQGVDVSRVEALFKKALALDPHSADAHLQLGILYDEQRRGPEAIAEFQSAIRLKPGDPDAHYRLAQAYLRAGDKERGQEELQLYEKLRAR